MVNGTQRFRRRRNHACHAEVGLVFEFAESSLGEFPLIGEPRLDILAISLVLILQVIS